MFDVPGAFLPVCRVAFMVVTVAGYRAAGLLKCWDRCQVPFLLPFLVRAGAFDPLFRSMKRGPFSPGKGHRALPFSGSYKRAKSNPLTGPGKGTASIPFSHQGKRRVLVAFSASVVARVLGSAGSGVLVRSWSKSAGQGQSTSGPGKVTR